MCVSAQTTVTFTKGQRATIILPTEPDASKGKYYRMDRWEDGKLVFEEEPCPQARTPYVIMPYEDFDIDLDALDVDGLYFDTLRITTESPLDFPYAQVHFIGTYAKREIGYKDGCFHYFILDTTPDCVLLPIPERYSFTMGALRAHFEVSIDLCYDMEERTFSKTLEYVFHETPTSINDIPQTEVQDGEIANRKLYDLQGRQLPGKPARGIYIEGGKKMMK